MGSTSITGGTAATASQHSHTPSHSHAPSYSHSQNRTPAQRLPPGSAGSEAGSREKKDRQSFWDATFGKEHHHGHHASGQGKHGKSHDPMLDGSQASPPSRGQS